MSALVDDFTSTGIKYAYHQAAMKKFQEGVGTPIVSHLMLTDHCNAKCAFCSVHHRPYNTLPFDDIEKYLDILVPLGLKATILSGGGNPILYRDKLSGKNFNDVIKMIRSKGLEIGLITNGMPLKEYPCGRKSWIAVDPESLDECTWIRISMAGLDHEEKEVYVPDIDKSKTTLGFSWIMHDIYQEPADKRHGKVSTLEDLITPLEEGNCRVTYGEDRLPWIEEQIKFYVGKYEPSFTRLLANCLQPDQIPRRHELLNAMAKRIDPKKVFSQFKPPKAPHSCFIGFFHPVLNTDGFTYACDSVVLNPAAGHKFDNPWRLCHWSEVGKLYDRPVSSLVDSQKLCPGCVFHKTNDFLKAVQDGMPVPVPLSEPIHSSFV